ncbi:MAG TPA: hypothetical protein VGD77_11275 [Gemmatimonadaceae bacterium]
MNIRRHLLAAALTACIAPLASAQTPGLAVLQNAWANPGITAAVDAGFGGGTSTFAGAAAWAPGSARFQLSLAAGVRNVSGTGAAATGGARIAVPFWSTSSGKLGVAGFAGIGSSKLASDTNVAGGSAILSQVPIGLSVGYRMRLGATRGISAYASPFYALWRRDLPAVDATATQPAIPGTKVTNGLFRVGLGVDVGVTSRLGVTGGVELGATKNTGAGPGGTIATIAASWAFGAR